MLRIHTFDYTPILGWSVSRYDTFCACKRQYFYQYYGRFDRQIPRERIDRLKNLSSIPLEVGNLVHDTIAAVLRRLLQSGRDIDRTKFREFVEKKAALNCRTKEFFEVHYAESEAVEPEDLLPAVTECLDTFLASPRFEWIRRTALASKEDWLVEPPGYGETRLGDLKLYCKVDFLFVVDGRVVILDWKTGKPDPEKHARQLLGYSAWAAHHLGRPAAFIDAVIAYLRPAYQEVCRTPTEPDLAAFAERIRSETGDMHRLCADVGQNVPRSKDEFTMADAAGLCRRCDFKELCGRP